MKFSPRYPIVQLLPVVLVLVVEAFLPVLVARGGKVGTVAFVGVLLRLVVARLIALRGICYDQEGCRCLGALRLLQFD